MKNSLLFSILVITSLSATLAQEEPGWHLAKEIADVRVFEQYPEDREEVDYKVVTHVDVHPDSLLAFLTRFENYQRFLAFYASTTTLKQVGPHEFYGYGVMHPIPGGPGRDVVLHVTFSKLSHGWIGKGSSVPDYLPLQPGISRDSVLQTMWVIQGIQGEPAKCRYTYQVSINKAIANQAFIHQLAQTNFENVQRLKALLEAGSTRAGR